MICADVGLRGAGLEVRPAGLRRDPEDVVAGVLVAVLGVGARVRGGLRHQGRVLLLEGVANVLEEDEAEDHVLVLGGVHVVAEGVGHLPQVRPRKAGGCLWCWTSSTCWLPPSPFSAPVPSLRA